LKWEERGGGRRPGKKAVSGGQEEKRNALRKLEKGRDQLFERLSAAISTKRSGKNYQAQRRGSAVEKKKREGSSIQK